MAQLMTMFSTFVGFVAAIILITETVNKLFKIENSTTKLIISWVLSIGIAALGFGFQLGFFADCGTPDQWQGWVKTALIGFGCALAANKIYDRDEIWALLEKIFPIIGKKKELEQHK